MTINLNFTRSIENFVTADECEPVAVVVSGPDAWSVQKACELINSSPQMYDALGAVSQFLHVCPNDGTDERFNALLLQMERAIAAACGGMLQRDLRRPA
jgi:hypothetical protein